MATTIRNCKSIKIDLDHQCRRSWANEQIKFGNGTKFSKMSRVQRNAVLFSSIRHIIKLPDTVIQ